MSRNQLVQLGVMAAGLVGWAVPALAVESRIGGWATISHHEGRTGYRLNDMNRNDNAFSGLRINPEVQVRLDGGLELNAEYLIDAGASTGLSNTFLRLWGEWEEAGGQRWLNFKVGSLPLVFGTYGERANQKSNPVIGVPLLSGYHTSLSMQFVPVNGDSLLNRRGRGQFGINYTSGSGFKGMVMVYEPCWDMGLEAYGAHGAFEYAVALTEGTPSAAVLFGNETNDEPGFVGRLGLSNLPGALFGARLGVSYATGAFYSNNVAMSADRRNEDFDQIVWGYDAEYSIGRFVVRSEGVWNSWQLPGNDDPARWLPDEVEANAFFVESAVKLMPGATLGARYDQINFDEITGPTGRTQAWDANVRRVEGAFSFRPAREWEIRVAY
ncbi:MAG: hypothetical protein SGI90_15720, partial [Candidatus Eisenbacteria bacterium]|nr:hypothetical protein [Candidatus Eisenbacteria bacterium]